jgi:hypothetical protein
MKLADDKGRFLAVWSPLITATFALGAGLSE